jgi:MFS family permease
MGLVFSAFSWSYAALQIPGGIFLDRFGTRLTYFIAVVCWSVFTGLMGVVRSLNALILTRIGVGVFEAPCFPPTAASWRRGSRSTSGRAPTASTPSGSTSASGFSACRSSG